MKTSIISSHTAPLVQKYLSCFVYEAVRIYHLEGKDRLCTPVLTSVQGLKDDFWDIMYKVNHSKIFLPEFDRYLKYVLRYSMTAKLIRQNAPENASEFIKKYKLTGFKNNFWRCVLYFPAMLLTNYYFKKRCRF